MVSAITNGCCRRNTKGPSVYVPFIDATAPLHRSVAGLYGLPGLGAGEGQQIALQTVSSAGAIATGTAPLWTQAAWAVPVIGGAVAGVALAITAWFNRKGPKQRIATTEIVNELEPYLRQNLAAYQSGPHTVSSQAQALANFDAVWQTLEDACRQEQYGDPGVRCIEDRRAGACQWKDSSGKCWNWFSGYRDPIANDSAVRPDPTFESETGKLVDTLTGGDFETGGSGLNLLLLGGAALALVFVMRGGK